MIHFSPTIGLLTLTLLFFFFTYAAEANPTRRGNRILHQPFFPVESDVPPVASPPLSPQPHQKQQPKLPVSTTPSTPQSTFFPTSVPSPPPPVPPPPKYVATFPANISALLFPHPPSTSLSRNHIIILAVSVSFLSVALIILLAAFAYFYRCRSLVAVEKGARIDSVPLYPPNTATSDGGVIKHRSSSNSSSNFLYLGMPLLSFFLFFYRNCFPNLSKVWLFRS